MNEQQFSKVKTAEGFIAALDQSGGSTPKALKLYGIQDGACSGDEEMFDLVHAMRTRIPFREHIDMRHHAARVVSPKMKWFAGISRPREHDKYGDFRS